MEKHEAAAERGLPMTKNLADELERLATKLDDEPDAARRIYRTAALSLWVENNLPQILSALRAKPAEGEPVAWPGREAVARIIGAACGVTWANGVVTYASTSEDDRPIDRFYRAADALLSGGGE